MASERTRVAVSVFDVDGSFPVLSPRGVDVQWRHGVYARRPGGMGAVAPMVAGSAPSSHVARVQLPPPGALSTARPEKPSSSARN
jgi:hypothetical protein